jgi:hypothetical protein
MFERYISLHLHGVIQRLKFSLIWYVMAYNLLEGNEWQATDVPQDSSLSQRFNVI